MGESKSARCDDLESLKKRNCKTVENPRGSFTVDKNKPVTVRKTNVPEKLMPEQITQIQPQKLTLNLRSGKYSSPVAKTRLKPSSKKFVIEILNQPEKPLHISTAKSADLLHISSSLMIYCVKLDFKK